MTEEQIILVNEQDHVLGSIEKLRARETGQLHRAFSVFVFSYTKERELLVLLQQRALHKYHSAGLWTNTCCSHPRFGEATQIAAERRLEEEIGLVLPLQARGRFIYRAELGNGLVEHELDYVFTSFLEKLPAHIAFNPAEVAAVVWQPVAVLEDALQEDLALPVQERRYTQWLQQALQVALLSANS